MAARRVLGHASTPRRGSSFNSQRRMSPTHPLQVHASSNSKGGQAVVLNLRRLSSNTGYARSLTSDPPRASVSVSRRQISLRCLPRQWPPVDRRSDGYGKHPRLPHTTLHLFHLGQYFQGFVHRDLFASGGTLDIFPAFLIENAIESSHFLVRMVPPQSRWYVTGFDDFPALPMPVEDPYGLAGRLCRTYGGRM